MNTLIESLNTWSQAWWPYVVHATWQAALVALVALAVVFTCKRLPSPWRYALLLVALVKFAVPPVLTTKFGLFYWTGPTVETVERVQARQVLPPDPGLAKPAAENQESRAAATPPPPQVRGESQISDSISPIPAPAPTTASFSPLAWLLLLHAAGALAALIYIGAGLWQLLGLSRRAKVIDATDSGPGQPPPIYERFISLKRRLGIKDEISLLITDEDVPPIAYWLGRPIVMIPRNLIDRLTPQQLDAVMAHELIHHRRNDWAANGLQLLLTAVWWFNPLIWLLNRALNETREQCCDDAVVGSEFAAPKDYCRTLLSSAETLTHPRPIAATLGFAERLHPVAGRIKRITDPKLWRVPKLSAGAMVVVALLAVAVLPGLRSQAEKPEPKPAVAPAQWTDVVTVTVVDEDTGEPIPKAQISARAQVGKGEARYPYETDERGDAEVRYDAGQHQWFQLVVTAPDYVRMASTHQNVRVIGELPETLRFKMPRATRIGGGVRDAEGNPIKGAKVEISLPWAINHPSPAAHAAVSNQQGGWHIDVPKKLGQYRIEVSHRDFVDLNSSSVRNAPTEKQLRDQSAIFVLNKGLTLEGTVTDSNGQPVEGASIFVGIYRGFGQEATTDSDGRYKVRNIKPGPNNLTVEAAGYGPQMVNVTIKPGMQPHDFQLAAGHTVRGRVVDPNGDPIEGVRIAEVHWRGLLTLQWKARTDAEGRFEWRDAPEDTVIYHFYKEGYMTPDKFLTPGPEEHQITFYPNFKVRGTVVDAETGKPIEKFTVVPGGKWEGSETFVWSRYDGGTQKGGRYEVSLSGPSSDPILGHLVRIEATGYKPAISTLFQAADGDAVFDFKLEKTSDLTGRILLPNGRPAAEAKVMVQLPGQPAVFESGSGMQMLDTAPNTITDAEGRFTLAPQDSHWRLVAVHDVGYGEADESAFAESSDIQLRPWGRVEGVVRVGSKPGAGVEIWFWDGVYDPVLPRVTASSQLRVDESGRFMFNKVRPGVVGIGGLHSYYPGYHMLQKIVHVEVQPGQTHQVSIGGKGRPVIGRVTDAPTGEMYFGMHRLILTSADEKLKSHVPDGWGASGDFQERYLRWMQQQYTEAGIAIKQKRNEILLDNPPQFGFMLEDDGSFRIEDVPAGEYTLRLTFLERREPAELKLHQEAEVNITVPEMPGGRSDEPLDVGTIELITR